MAQTASASRTHFVKDPEAKKDYVVTWAGFLGTDTISTSIWLSVPTNIVAASPASSFTTTTATVWLEGGTDGIDYTITNRITTAGGRTDDLSVIVQVRHQ